MNDELAEIVDEYWRKAHSAEGARKEDIRRACEDAMSLVNYALLMRVLWIMKLEKKP